jgi:histone H3/H4
MAPSGRLTAFAFFSDAKCDELKQAGRVRVPNMEILDYWRRLVDEERKPWEEKAAAAQEVYLKECMDKCMADEDGEEESHSEEEDASAEDDEGEGEDDEDEVSEGSMRLPYARVKRIAQADERDETLGREAVFATCKAAEAFVERCVWGSVRAMERDGRKTIKLADVTTAMRLHPTPESMQFFWEELQPAPPPPPVQPTGKKKAGGSGMKRKAAAPPKGKGRPAKKKEDAEPPPQAEAPGRARSSRSRSRG